jgi:asparagine synthase (glutamine-hydrolysing)
LGHARLSIIDLSGGFQPIHNEDETLWIVFNGEIFNYPEIRRKLIQRGHRFYTESDTEVILHLYEDHGAACLDSLNGQFAFAIWDARKNELFLARDRLGILPLHYTVQNGSLIFASEIKSIFAADGIARSIDPIAMDQIFTFWTTLPEGPRFRTFTNFRRALYESSGERSNFRNTGTSLLSSREQPPNPRRTSVLSLRN